MAPRQRGDGGAVTRVDVLDREPFRVAAQGGLQRLGPCRVVVGQHELLAPWMGRGQASDGLAHRPNPDQQHAHRGPPVIVVVRV